MIQTCPWGGRKMRPNAGELNTRTYLLSATAAIALMASGAAAHDNHPVTLIEGLGDHHHTIATTQKDAQSYFNQGLILTFAFNHAEAIRAYRARCGAGSQLADAALGHRLCARSQLQPAGRTGRIEAGP